MAVNTRGLFECVKAVLPVTRRERYGKIINIASVTVFKESVTVFKDRQGTKPRRRSSCPW
jgi:NAD(P)-dependent dehydrogenase (short-subunit alcohol dehydrogenase family)